MKQFLNNANISATQIPKNEKLWAQIRNIRGFEMLLATSNDFGSVQTLVTWNALQRIEDQTDNSIR